MPFLSTGLYFEIVLFCCCSLLIQTDRHKTNREDKKSVVVHPLRKTKIVLREPVFGEHVFDYHEKPRSHVKMQYGIFNSYSPKAK